MKMRNLFLIALLVLSLGSSLIASAQDTVELTFTFWIPTDHVIVETALGPIADAYMEANPNVTINYEFIPFAEYETTIATRLSGSDAPDAGWIVERNGPAFIDSGVLYDMGDILRADADYNYADFSEAASSQWLDGDAVYGIPFSTSPFITIYNKTLFDEAGIDTPDVLAANSEWTWEALRESAKAISDASDTWGFVGTDGGAGMYQSVPYATLIPVLRAYGTDIIQDGACVANSDEAVEAISLLHGMVFDDQSAVPPGDETVFWTGDVGVTFGQISRLSNLDEADFEWGIAPMPTGPAGESPVIGQAAITVFDGQNNENQEVAADFVRFMTTQDGVSQMAPFFPPARISVLESEAFLTGNSRVSPEGMESIIVPAIANGTVLTSHARFPEIELTGAVALDTLWMPGADVGAALDLYCQTITPFLSE
jgi:multiple sugar transport system substrate-binding protein